MLKVSFYTNRGSFREKNEDAVLVGEVFQEDMKEPLFLEGNFPILAAADGIGGSAGGEIASKTVLEAFKKEKAVEKALYSAKKKLEEIASKNPSLKGLGTTIAGIKIGNSIELFNCGDTRIYKKRKNYLTLASVDHSSYEGFLTCAVADNYPLGVEIRTATGGLFLIATDGVYKEFSHEELEEIITDDPFESSQRLFEKLKQKPQRDNVSFIIAKV